MISLLHLHIITFLIIFINLLIFNKNITTNLGSKYFFINYIFHHHRRISCFLICYPFVIITIYYLLEDIFPIGSFFISILHVYFLYEIISKRDLDKREAYIAWYKKNVRHSFSMHTYDMIKKDFKFLNEKISRIFLFKFEIILFVSLVVESEVMYEVFAILDKLK